MSPNEPTVVIRPDIEDEAQNVRKDFLDERIFGNDDNIVLVNVLDGKGGRPRAEFVFTYNGVAYRIQPGQTFRLPGYQAQLFIKHIVSYCYRHIDKKPEMDKRMYPLNDPWVKQVVLDVQASPNPETQDRNEVHDVPEYIHQDSEIDPNTGLAGRLEGAMNQGGGGEVEAGRAVIGEDATDEDVDKIPDFDPRLNPRQGTVTKVNGEPIEGDLLDEGGSSDDKDDEAFSAAKKPARQAKK